jgi:hypothetical protein
MTSPRNEWLGSEVEIVRTLLSKGATRSEIAARLGNRSREAVSGLIHRGLKLPTPIVGSELVRSRAKAQPRRGRGARCRHRPNAPHGPTCRRHHGASRCRCSSLPMIAVIFPYTSIRCFAACPVMVRVHPIATRTIVFRSGFGAMPPRWRFDLSRLVADRDRDGAHRHTGH